MPGVSSRSLADVARDVAAGVATPAELHAAFLASTVYCERSAEPDAEPGFRALGAAGQGLVPVYSSPEQLALARGTVRWFALTGSELLDLLPAGYDVLLDQGGAAPLRLHPAALIRRVSIEIDREGAG